MPWLLLKEPFDWKPRANMVIAYPPGTFLVTTRCAQAAEAAGKGEKVPKPDGGSSN